MQTPEITAYLKTYCGWSAGVRAVLAKYNLPYTEKDIIQNPAFRWEMETKSGQPLSPSVEINGQMLADVSGEEVESYLIDNKLVQPSDAATDVPTNAPCPTEQHEGALTHEVLRSSPGAKKEELEHSFPLRLEDRAACFGRSRRLRRFPLLRDVG